MKEISFACIGVLSMVVVATAGCKKCMCCTETAAEFYWIKGADTVYISISGGYQRRVQDTINLYLSKGFSIDTGYLNPYERIFTCGKAEINSKLAEGQGCNTPPTISGYCP